MAVDPKNTSIDKSKNAAKVRFSTATLVAVSGMASFQAVQAIAAATATLPIIAKLVRAVELTVSTTLDFGTLAMTVDRAGNATLDPQLDRLVLDNKGSLSLAGGTPQAGRLRIKGAEFPVSVSVADATVKLTNGSETISITNFNLATPKGGTRVTFTPGAGSFSFTVPVGATVNTRIGQISGTYVGTTKVFASYQ